MNTHTGSPIFLGTQIQYSFGIHHIILFMEPYLVCVFLGRYNSIRCAWNDSKLIEKKFTDTSIERFVSYTLFHPK